MKELLWDKTLSIDVPEIDQDHRRLLELFNRLGQAAEDAEPQAYIEAIMDELISCTGWHFQHEERLMEKYGYHGLEEHRAEHQDLMARGRALQQQLRQAGAPPSVQEIAVLEHWLTGHIYGADMAMGAQLAEAM
ncbi:MAG: bacteriohemerythrin [Lamprobacter sp.]|uniref:bacteriohemerythrin n=1 Tax=Lamprobacter sp. TaxID=3100796 RepID=UPI002B257629|nr:bacteriohemerythrin [Lamprobacter sp.]MEA3641167.1 bacteriohemerythrin [Lamprobacter sp.]